MDGPRNDRSGSPESCGCLARATRNISPRSFARTKSERAPLRWGVIYVAEGGNCPRILCPACPRGRYIPPGCIHGKQCSQSRTPKRFLVSAVILAINRSPLLSSSLKYRVSSLSPHFFAPPSPPPLCPYRFAPRIKRREDFERVEFYTDFYTRLQIAVAAAAVINSLLRFSPRDLRFDCSRILAERSISNDLDDRGANVFLCLVVILDVASFSLVLKEN